MFSPHPPHDYLNHLLATAGADHSCVTQYHMRRPCGMHALTVTVCTAEHADSQMSVCCSILTVDALLLLHALLSLL